MKKILLIIIFAILSTCSFAHAQVTVSQEFVDDAAKAFKLIVEQRDAIGKQQTQIDALQKLVTDLTNQKVTPCSVAQEKFRVDVIFWAEKFEKADPNDKAYRKQLEKILKRTMKQGSKAIQSQCGFDEKSALEKAWEIAKPLIPVAAIILTR